MANIVIGTAGHIDHGKTTLIKALTGIETDTTKEEKKRGMSINLGFAYLDLPQHGRVGLVDVPGHEKFIKNMVAGLPGINLILLVVDAAEGIMPQTKEHMDILTLLGIRNFVIVLTKIDTIDDDLKELVIDDIRDQLADTPLSEAPIIETDAVSGKGIPELIDYLDQAVEEIAPPAHINPARLNIDRVFSVKGFGTVVTGTLLDGTLKIGDELTVYPSGKSTRIRNIQVHEKDQETVTAGQRTALNLANIKADELERGDVLSQASQLESSWMLDVKVTCLDHPGFRIGLWDRVRILIGTKEVMARTVPIGVEEITAGQEGYLQLRLEEEIAVKQGDRFIIRTYSPMITIGGGMVLEANPKKHRRFKQDIIESLKVKEEGSIDQVLLDFLLNKQDFLSSTKEMSEYLGMASADVEKLVTELIQQQQVVALGKKYLHRQRYQELADFVLAELNDYHKKYRLRAGMPVEELRSRLRSKLEDKDTAQLLKKLMEDELIKKQGVNYAAADFEIKFNKYQQAAKEMIESKLIKTRFMPLKVEDVIAGDPNAPEVIEALAGDTVTYLTHEYVMAASVYQEAVDLVTNYITENQEMALGDFRDLTESSRKSSMMILEYMDKNGVTKRVENKRVLA